MTTRTIFLAAGAAILILTGCNRGGGGEVVATVEGQPITMDEFHKYMEIKPTVNALIQGQSGEVSLSSPLAFQTLQDLIQRKLVLQLAADEGFTFSDKEVDDELKFREKLRPGFVRELTDSGLTLNQVKDSIRIDMAQEKLITKGITVTPEETEQFIKDNPKSFVEPATVDMLYVVVKDSAAKAKVDADLASGQKFDAVALANSVDPEAATNQCRFSNRIVDQYPDALKKAVQATPEGKTTAWITTSMGPAKFYIEKKTPERPLVMDEARKKQVMRELAIQRGRAANDVSKRLLEKLKTTKIEVSMNKLKKPWSDALKKIKAADTSSQGAGSTAGTTGGEPGPAIPGQITTGGTTGTTATAGAASSGN